MKIEIMTTPDDIATPTELFLSQAVCKFVENTIKRLYDADGANSALNVTKIVDGETFHESLRKE